VRHLLVDAALLAPGRDRCLDALHGLIGRGRDLHREHHVVAGQLDAGPLGERFGRCSRQQRLRQRPSSVAGLAVDRLPFLEVGAGERARHEVQELHHAPGRLDQQRALVGAGGVTQRLPPHGGTELVRGQQRFERHALLCPPGRRGADPVEVE
jgi:hypothetical protein